jgi:RNA polymerase sigma factor (sigma-70 family)
MPPGPATLLGQLRRLTAPAVSDAALLLRWKAQRDEDAFAALVARHGPMVLGVCRRVLGDVQRAEDAFQATFLVLARSGELRRPQALPSFLYGVALRLARRARGAARRRSFQPHGQAPEPADSRPDPLDVLSGRELLAVLDEEVARLPEVYRLPVLLCVMQGRSVEEAAQVLGWGTGSVRGRLARGRERLRDRLSRRGLGLSAGAVALLTPAALPAALLAASVRNLAGPAPSAVAALAAGSAPPLKVKLAGLALLLAVIGLGAGLPVFRAQAPDSPAEPAPASPAPAKEGPRRDRHGDPLPEGAVVRLGTLRFRVPGEVREVAFAPDGKTLAVSSGVLTLFDAASGKPMRREPAAGARRAETNFLAFSPDGKRLLGPGLAEDGEQFREVVRVWDVDGGGKPKDYDAERAVWMGWSADAEPMAVCLEAGALRLKELASGRSRRVECADLRQPELSAYVICACEPAGKALAVADEKGIVHVWDSATGRERCTVTPKGEGVVSLALTPDGRTLASLTREGAQLWDATTGKALHTVAADQKYLARVAFAPDGKALATVGWNDVRFWDAATGRERSRTQDRYTFAPTVAFSADGKTAVTAERHGNTVHLWDVATGKQAPAPAGHRSRPNGTAFTPDGRRVATGGGLDGTVRVWDLASGESLARVHRPGQWVRDVALSPDGKALFSSWTNDEVWVSDAATGERRHVIKLEDPDRPDTYQSAIRSYPSADGKTLVAFSYYYPKEGAGRQEQETLVTGWDTATRKQLFRRRRPGTDSWLALAPDARVLAAPHLEPHAEHEKGPGQGPMRLEDVATGELLLTFPALAGQTWPLAFSPDGRLLASNNSDWKRKGKEGDLAGVTGCALYLWETATAAEVLTLPLPSNAKAAFSPDGRLLAVSAPSQEIVVWDLARGRERRRFKGLDADVTDLAFAPDGRRLVSGLTDSTWLVWDLGPAEAAAAGKLGAEGLAKAWADLAGADAPRAFKARWALAGAPEEALPYLKERLRPARAADAQRLKRLLIDLDSDQFAVRQQAQEALEEIGDLAEPALRQALADKPPLDVRRRIDAALERLRGPATRPEARRSLRAVAVLEDVGTPAARQLLEELAAGAPEARLTREAKAALGRARNASGSALNR